MDEGRRRPLVQDVMRGHTVSDKPAPIAAVPFFHRLSPDSTLTEREGWIIEIHGLYVGYIGGHEKRLKIDYDPDGEDHDAVVMDLNGETLDAVIKATGGDVKFRTPIVLDAGDDIVGDKIVCMSSGVTVVAYGWQVEKRYLTSRFVERKVAPERKKM